MGAAVCVALTTVDSNGTVVSTRTVHTPAEPQDEGGGGSDTGIIVGVTVAVVACVGACCAQQQCGAIQGPPHALRSCGMHPA